MLINLEQDKDKITGTFRYDPDVYYAANRLERRGLGWTKGRGFKKLCNIPAEDYQRLLSLRDKDMVAFHESNGTSKIALNRLLARFPEWRTI